MRKRVEIDIEVSVHSVVVGFEHVHAFALDVNRFWVAQVPAHRADDAGAPPRRCTKKNQATRGEGTKASTCRSAMLWCEGELYGSMVYGRAFEGDIVNFVYLFFT